jgi:SOS-response transcriptional repressor LexA
MINNWTSRIKERMDILRLTQESLAQKIGVTQSAITHYLSGRRVPPLKQFHKLAVVLEVDPAWLQFGVQKNIQEYDQVMKQHRIPIIGWQDVNSSMNTQMKKEYVPNFYSDQSHWYALRIKNDSMIASTGHSQSFRPKDIIVIDSNKKPEHENYVIALLPRSNEVTFKQFVIDGGSRYLKPLNPQYPLIEIDNNTHIYGVVVACINPFI